jgi:phosphatidylinositol alpha-1,6-mannosyltransferase
MSTLVLTEHFLPVQGGSINWLVQTYSRYNSDEVVLVTTQRAGDWLVDQSLPFRVERLPMDIIDWDPTVPAALWRYGQILRYVRSHYRAQGVRQLHGAKVLPEGLVAWCMRGLSSLPYLLYAHGEEILIGLTSRKLRWLLPKIYNGAGAIIANASHTKALLEDIGVRPEKIHIVHPGVDVPAFRVGSGAVQTVRRRYNLGQSPILLTVGRLQRRKGHDMVIRALPHIVQKISNLLYVIVGTGEEQYALQKLAEDTGMRDKVVFVGQVPERELAAYYATCEVFIMPNRQINADIEGFGMVFLEAGAAGKPVIGGKSGGTEDAILDGVTGLRIDGTCVAEIVAAVVSLFSEPEKAKAMGERGHARVEAEFTWDAVVQHTRMVAARMER